MRENARPTHSASGFDVLAIISLLANMHIKNFTAILKVAEICNIDCDYCYYYNIGDESWREYPPYMDDETMQLIIRRLRELAQTHKVDVFRLVLHGGEPMMAKVDRLTSFVTRAREQLAELATVQFAIQTNGTILSPEWLSFFETNRITVGVSIDGPAEAHDQHRRTKQGKPTHKAVETFLSTCGSLAEKKRLHRLGTITVIDRALDVPRTVAYLQCQPGLSGMSFVMPDNEVNNILFNRATAVEYASTLIDIYNANVLERRIRNKEVLKFMSKLQPGNDEPKGVEGEIEYVGVTIQSNALMKVNEELIATGSWRKSFPSADLRITAVVSYLQSSAFSEYLRYTDRLPSKCEGCKWANVCRGGSMQERRNPTNGFNERSVFCESYQQLYDYMFADLVRHGYPEEKLRERLLLQSATVA
ncbi:MAG: radical SAM protein [Burkholderiaceae bacterium]